jgi:acyl-CoA synthetase (NDP forming)
VRDPEVFRRALAEAASREVPVIALKVGRTERSKAMVTAHSGALAGEHGAFEALFDAYGVHEVRTLDEMADTLELFSAPRRVRSGRGIASVLDSGGEARDVRRPRERSRRALRTHLGRDTTAMQEVLDPGVVAENPLDAWGTGIDADRIFRENFHLLHDDPETAAVGVRRRPRAAGRAVRRELHRDLARRVRRHYQAVLRAVEPAQRRRARGGRDPARGRHPGAGGHRERAAGIAASARRGRASTAVPGVVAPEPVADEVRDRWRARLTTGEEISELEGPLLLADYGVPVVPARGAASADEAVAAADELGWPVVLKTAAPGVQHKSDVGGVVVGVADEDALRDAVRGPEPRLGPQVTVAALAPAGVELALGIVRDPTFGPLVLVAAGGILVELLGDRKLALAPLDEAGARRLIDGLQVRPLLDGVRGAPASDVDAVAHAVSRLSVLAADLGEHLEALDVNPDHRRPRRLRAVDALVVARERNAPGRQPPTG